MKILKYALFLMAFALPVYASEADELKCIADNIYFEAGNQSVKGMIAVTNVVQNRIKDPRWPDTHCDVIKQGYKKGRRDCQFSWYCDGKSDEIPNNRISQEIYSLAQHIAMIALDRELPDFTNGAVNYHADWVNPWWTKGLTRTTKIGVHIFYK